MDKNISLSFIFGSDRSFQSDLQIINFYCVTMVAFHFLSSQGCGGAWFICVSDAWIVGAVQISINKEISSMGLKEFRQVCRLDPLKI